MAQINKIMVGGTIYNIVPETGTGLQLGTSVNNSHVIYVNLGNATCSDMTLPEPGISITPEGFNVNAGKFKAFVKALGFKEE
jgi:hypothetical protein